VSAPNSPYARPDAQSQPDNVRAVLARLDELANVPVAGQMDLFTDTTENDQPRGKQ
jgi:hypothetical protein